MGIIVSLFGTCLTFDRVDIIFCTMFKRAPADYISTVLSIPLRVVTVDGKTFVIKLNVFLNQNF